MKRPAATAPAATVTAMPPMTRSPNTHAAMRMAIG